LVISQVVCTGRFMSRLSRLLLRPGKIAVLKGFGWSREKLRNLFPASAGVYFDSLL